MRPHHLAVVFLAACAHTAPTREVILRPKPIVVPPDVAPLPNATLAFKGDATSADVAPAPISGGTVILTKKHAWVSGPDAGVVDVVDLETKKLAKTFHVGKSSLPGRLAERPDGKVSVVLRGEGSIATMDLDAQTVKKYSVCPDPRGIAAAADRTLVACATGELVTIPHDGSDATKVDLGRDLRDVVLDNFGHAYVTRFRRAEILEVDRSGTLLRTLRPAETDDTFDQREKIPSRFMAHVAWRAIPAPDGSIFVLHQYETTRDIPIGMEPQKDQGRRVSSTAPYGGGDSEASDPCGNGHLVIPAVTHIENGRIKGTLRLQTNPAVDIARAQSGGLVMVHPGGKTTQFAIVPDGAVPTCGGTPDASIPIEIGTNGTAIAVAASDQGIAVHSRDPDELTIVSGIDKFVIPLTHSPNHDAGHAIFHHTTSVGIACMSCHPEGGDDGHTWAFRGVGPRRTQSLRGGLLATAPFHWDGEMNGISVLARDVFTRRMGGDGLSDEQVATLGKWLDRLPAAPAPVIDKAAAERGHVVFLRSGCSGCHDGPQEARDVGTGGVFQVPSLAGVGNRAPFMHDGCAPTLADRFTSPQCGGTKHGSVAANERGDLVKYLETL
jgi:hypothetical protein